MVGRATAAAANRSLGRVDLMPEQENGRALAELLLERLERTGRSAKARVVAAAADRAQTHLEDVLAPVLERHGAQLVRAGSIFWMSLSPGEAPRSAEAISPEAVERYTPIFHALLERGIALAPSAYEVGFLSAAHTDDHIAQLAGAMDEVLTQQEGS